MTWEEMLKQLHGNSAEEEKTAAASTSKGLKRIRKESPSRSSAKRRWTKKSIEGKASSSTKETTGVQAQASKHDRLLVLADAVNIAQIGDDVPLVNPMRNSQKKINISDVEEEA